MKLDVDQITVRTAVKEDAPVIAKWWNDGTVMLMQVFLMD